ncbi:MAG: VOC family protein [Candidatus Caldarchaeum sp.]
MESLAQGLHHVTLVTGSYAVNKRFYTEVLGLRQVKLSVNQDDIFHRHAFYANPDKPTGSAITFFEWPQLPQGFPGLGSPHHVAYRVVSFEGLANWFKWLRRHGLDVKGPYLGHGLVSVYFRDPDGVLIELTVADEGFEKAYVEEFFAEAESPSGLDSSMKILRFDHVSPLAMEADLVKRFLEKFLFLKDVSVVGSGDRVWLEVVRDGEVFIRYLVDHAAEEGFVGIGSVHHFAVAVETEEDQKTILQKLRSAGVINSGIIDRHWFKSLYFRDIYGNLLEVATVGPGYDVDEPRETMGGRLVLPPWLEPMRNIIEAKLSERDRENIRAWRPEYPAVEEPPEP